MTVLDSGQQYFLWLVVCGLQCLLCLIIIDTRYFKFDLQPVRTSFFLLKVVTSGFLRLRLVLEEMLFCTAFLHTIHVDSI